MAFNIPNQSIQNNHATKMIKGVEEAASCCASVPEVHLGMSELQSSLERAHAALSVLEDRLSDVLIPTPVTSEKALSRGAGSSLGQAIIDRTSEVDAIRYRIDNLISSLAV